MWRRQMTIQQLSDKNVRLILKKIQRSFAPSDADGKYGTYRLAGAGFSIAAPA